MLSIAKKIDYINKPTRTAALVLNHLWIHSSSEFSEFAGVVTP